MNIQLLTPSFYQNRISNNKQVSQRNFSLNTGIQRSTLSGLNADTVSFTGKNPITNGPFREIIASTYEVVEAPLLAIAGNKYMAALQAIANKLEPFGVHFDSKYNANPIKSTKSYMSKLRRSGAAPKDKVRATLFLDNPYDLKLISKHILPELRGLGYEIVGLGEQYKNGKTPVDFDIRLDGIKPKHTEVLDEPLRNLISGPQKSGYEDIQMRLYDTTVAKAKQVPHELLIVFGKETSKAKHDESKYVYDITRELSDMHIVRDYATKDGNNHVRGAKAALNVIRTQLNSNISIPLFSNAKNKDYYHSNIEAPVRLTARTCKILQNNLETLQEDINSFYRKEIKKVRSREYDPVIERMVKATYEYKKRDTKQVFAADIIEKRKALVRALRDELKDDRDILKFARERLKETLAKYGEAPRS